MVLAFNRTIVELKYLSNRTTKSPLKSFNRTIVELKYHKNEIKTDNRAF